MQSRIRMNTFLFLFVSRDVSPAKKNGESETLLPIVLPHVQGHKRVIYTVYEYDPLLDSSNMTMDDWITIAKVRTN